MNMVMITGRLTKDPETLTDCINFSLAVERAYKNSNNARVTDFINCTAFGNTAKFMQTYIHKGDLLAVQGRLETRTYKNKQDVQVSQTKIMVDSLECMCKYQAKQQQEPHQDTRVANTYNYGSEQSKQFGEGSSDTINPYSSDDDSPF